MHAEAGGDGFRVSRRKRDLHDASQDGLFTDNPSSKRRLTNGAEDHDDAENTPNSSSFKFRRPKVESNSSSKSPKPQLDTLQFSSRSSGPPAPNGLLRGWPFNPHLGNDSAARPSGPSGPPGATGGHWGAKPSFPSLSYGFGSANGAAAAEDSRNDKKPDHEAKGRSHSTRRGALDAVLPSSRLNRTKETPQAIISSDDDSYVGEGGEDSDAEGVKTTRQHSARLKARGSTGNVLEKKPDNGLNVDHKIKQGPFEKTPSGKDYHKLPLHIRSEFNDNLDRGATIEFVGHRDGASGRSRKSIIVSQTPRQPDAPVNGSSTLQANRNNVAVGATAKEETPSGPFDLPLDALSSSGIAEEDSAASTPSELDQAKAKSKVWAYVGPLVPNSWAASVNDGREKRAFIQAISLPLKNEIDMEWLAGTKSSHQRLYRALMSVVFQAVGVEAHCKPCDSKIPERRRNCKVLPPEAAGLRELQEVCGSQCVNCFFFHASTPCEFPDSSTTTKQTPIPVPVPRAVRPIPVIKRSYDSPPANTVRPTASSRPFVPPYSLYKVQKTEKPISESPVPVPSFAIQGPNHQTRSQPQRALDVPSEKPETKPPRRSNRISKAEGESGNSSGSTESDTRDKAQSPSPGLAVSNDGPARTTLTSGGSHTEASTEAASSLSSGDISPSRLASRMFSLFGDIGRLPAEEQATMWNQMQQMSAMLHTGDSGALGSSGTQNSHSSLRHGPSAAVADEWEIAPGRLTTDDRPMAFSTSFLSRELISVNAAQQLSQNHSVLNKNITALHQLAVGPENGWKCTFTVIRGVLKIKAGDVEARIGQGGLVSVDKKCIITNVSHKEARVQVCWVEEG
ncbi:hypothetical protein DHEL01_v207377 [Diaporthe helianthi]|uniref:Uncharacterized protein n=1 Tax=Diaporthe helianthi TaxID=158607 RepID=A0A2P5HVF3_DIAHE|nr:hypothetical protein DHEL01_v207377 [Diaporthe helianthi]